MLFPTNPFLCAIERFTDALVPHFQIVDQELWQSTRGETRSEVALYPSARPSKFGYMIAEFSYGAGDVENLRHQREEALEDSPGSWVPEDGPQLTLTRRYEAPPVREPVSQELVESAFCYLDAFRRGQPESVRAVVDVCARRPSLDEVFGPPRVVFRPTVEITRMFSTTDVHALKWEAIAVETAQLVSDLCEMFVGERPPVLSTLLP